MTQGSYLLLAPQMPVRAQDGTELGYIVEVAADEASDIFRGIVVATRDFMPRTVWVPGEHVVSVIADIATLDLTRETLSALETVGGVAAHS